MIVRGTNKIRGVLSLQLEKSILEVAPNAAKHISSEDFNKHEVQQAVALGYLKVEQKQTSLETPTVSGVPLTTLVDSDRKIKCRNEYARPITMNMFQFPINPGQEFTISEKEANSPEIKSAIAKGYIKVLEAKDINQTISKKSDEVTINVSRTMMQEQMKENDRNKNTRHLSNDHQPLETNEELTTPTAVVDRGIKTVQMKTPIIDDPDPKPVQASDVKRNTIVWNPSKNKVTNTMIHDQEIGFVDAEQQQQRIQAHPKLKDQAPVDVSELQFVDQSQEQQRIQAHPVLKSIEEEFADESPG